MIIKDNGLKYKEECYCSYFCGWIPMAPNLCIIYIYNFQKTLLNVYEMLKRWGISHSQVMKLPIFQLVPPLMTLGKDVIVTVRGKNSQAHCFCNHKILTNTRKVWSIFWRCLPTTSDAKA
jgi:hypothetical protein